MGWRVSFTKSARRKGAKLPKTLTVTYHEEFGWKLAGVSYDLNDLGPEARAWLSLLDPMDAAFCSSQVRDLILKVFNPLRIRLEPCELVLIDTFDQLRETNFAGGYKVIRDLTADRASGRLKWD